MGMLEEGMEVRKGGRKGREMWMLEEGKEVRKGGR